MTRTTHSDRLRYRYGMCLNDQCEKCKGREVQQIPARKDFVCEACGKSLRECPPPKSFMQKNGKLVYAAIAVVVIAAIVALAVLLGGNDDKKPVPKPVPVADTATVAKPETKTVPDTNKVDTAKTNAEDTEKAVEQPAPEEPKVETKHKPAKEVGKTPSSKSASSSKNLGYATYTGPMKNGKPDGTGGKLKFKASHVIETRDSQQRVAEAGDYVIGEFKNGHLVSGRWYGADGVVKGALLIGE